MSVFPIICQRSQAADDERNADSDHEDRVHLEKEHEIERGEKSSQAASDSGNEIEVSRVMPGGLLVLHNDAYRVRRNHAGEDRGDEKEREACGERAEAGIRDLV